MLSIYQVALDMTKEIHALIDEIRSNWSFPIILA
jgi:hypothetical protein